MQDSDGNGMTDESADPCTLAAFVPVAQTVESRTRSTACTGCAAPRGVRRRKDSGGALQIGPGGRSAPTVLSGRSRYVAAQQWATVCIVPAAPKVPALIELPGDAMNKPASLAVAFALSAALIGGCSRTDHTSSTTPTTTPPEPPTTTTS